MNAAETRAFLETWVDQVWNNGNNDLIARYVAPDYVMISPGVPEVRGPEGFRHFRDLWRTAMPDIHMTLEDGVVEGDRATWRMSVTGTHQGDLFGIPATGRHGSSSTIVMSRFADGKWAADYVLIDMLGLLQNLGIIPRPGAVPA